MNIISGEKIQLTADLFIGSKHDFNSNPFIYNNKNAPISFDLRQLVADQMLNNPTIIYCHGHYIPILSSYGYRLNNPFILITHNSDYNIIDDSVTRNITSNPKLIKWFGQNVGYKHDKISFIPIGIANRMWPHGRIFDMVEIKMQKPKNNMVFMNFCIDTNHEKRQNCYNTLVSKNVEFLPNVTCAENLDRMKTYKFCICPEGNGFDTHRLWEALFFKCIPILIKNTFSEIVSNTTKLPMILLNSWDEFDISLLPEYSSFDFITSRKYLSLNYYTDNISCLSNA